MKKLTCRGINRELNTLILSRVDGSPVKNGQQQQELKIIIIIITMIMRII